MALSDTTLSGLIKPKIVIYIGQLFDVKDNVVLDKVAQAIADAVAESVVSHVTSNGEVLPGTFKDAESRPIVGIGVIQ